MHINRLIGLILFAVGLLLLKFAYDATQAPMEELSNQLTGNYSDKTMWYFGASVIALVSGVLLSIFGARR